MRLACLQFEAQDKAQARKDELQHQLERYRIEADTKIRLRQLELQGKQKDIVLENRSCADSSVSNVNSVALTSDSVNSVPPSTSESSLAVAAFPRKRG